MKREMRTAIEEIARVALEREDIAKYIGHELDLSGWYLDEIYAKLEAKAQAEEQAIDDASWRP